MVVTGQRRQGPAYAWPSHSYQIPDLPQHNTPEHNPDEGGTGSICDDPRLKAEWDKDAAAAKAMKALLEKAALAGEPLGARERAIVLYEAPVGSIQLGVIAEGPLVTEGTGSRVTLNFDGIDRTKVVGFVHNHPSGDKRPSPADWGIYDGIMGEVGAARASGVRIYMIGNTHPAGQDPVLALFIYDNRNRAGGDPGPEVNPDGEPC